MIRGEFRDNLPFEPVNIGWGQIIQNPICLLDTGFTGDMQITPEMAKVLNIRLNQITLVMLADGSQVSMATGAVIAYMEGDYTYVEVLVPEGTPIVGMRFLSKFNYKAIIDVKHEMVSLERVKN